MEGTMKRPFLIVAWVLSIAVAYLAGNALAPATSASAQSQQAPAAGGRGNPPAGALPPGQYSKIQLSPDQGVPTHFRGVDLRSAHTQAQARAKQGGQGAVVPRDLMKSMVTRTHSYIMVHRGGQATGNPEQHEGVTDVYFVTGGSGSVVVGGDIPNRRTVRPGEYSGDPITGGQTFKLEAGDILNIPPNATHATMADPGGMTYVLMKVNVGMYPWSLVNGTP
jgi:mannose-6-phosphate isomerase-like protein (cupin superfamily)